MSRFFVSPENISQDKIEITGPDVKHITKVLRLKQGDVITVSDGQGMEYEAVITEYDGKNIICDIKSVYEVNREAPVRVILVQGLPKGDKMELIIQKCTELGVAEIIPVATERTVVQLDDKKAEQRRERWQRVAEEAAKQSRRTVVPNVRVVSTLQKIIGQVPKKTLAIIPWEAESANGIKQILTENGQVDEVYIFIGPEGGFSAKEIDMAKDNNIYPVTMGPRIMRTETAGLAALTMVLYHLGDLGGVSQ